MRNQIKSGLAGILLAGTLLVSDAFAQTNTYSAFTKKQEIADIIKHSKRIGIEPELLMATRMTENGPDRLAYGIIPYGKAKANYDNDKGYTFNGKFIPYKNEVEKQLSWAGWTIKKRKKEFDSMSGKERAKYRDFIDFLGDKYAPRGVANDPNNLNANWERNFRSFYKNLKSEK